MVTPAELDFQWHGRMGKGYARIARELRREEAAERDSRTRPERRRKARR